MSFLLDALRKSERSARERSVPSIHSTEPGGLQRIGRSELALHLSWILPALLLLVWLGLRQFGIFVDPEADRATANAGGIEGSRPAMESAATALGDGRTPVEKLVADRSTEADPGGPAARRMARKAQRDAAMQARRATRQAEREAARPAGKPSAASTQADLATQPAKPASNPADRQAQREAATQARRDARQAERAAKLAAKRATREAATQARRAARQAEREAAKLAGKSSTASTQVLVAPKAQPASTPAAREVAKPIGEPAAEPSARPAVQPTVEPLSKPEPRPAPAPRENFIDYWQLPDNVRKQLPEISINVLVFAENPSNRFILVNGTRLIEGDALQPGLVLQEIRRDGVIFSYRNYRFLVTT